MNTPMRVLGLGAVSLSLLLATSISTLAIATVPHASTSAPAPSCEEKASMTFSDVKALTKGGIGDDVILSQIRSTHSVFRLTTADILDLKKSEVREKVIDFMINTANLH